MNDAASRGPLPCRRNSHPAPYGSSLSSSGLADSASLLATTLPAKGLYTSDAALTDSTTAQASPAFSARPASGTSTNTRSPSALCACSEMPTSTTPLGAAPFAGRTHSWLLVYRKSVGMLLKLNPPRVVESKPSHAAQTAA